jgi:hypothetical protein
LPISAVVYQVQAVPDLFYCPLLQDHFVKEFKEPLNLKYIGKLMPYLCFGNFLASCRK